MRPVSIVVAYSRISRVIGREAGLPWPPLRQDLLRLKALTTRHAVIMGRNTFESAELCAQPLPHRRNVVLSRNPAWAPPPGVVHAADWREALHLADGGYGGAGYDNGDHVLPASPCATCIFVLGGERVYRTALRHGCNWIFATELHGNWQGDSFFPKLSDEWLCLPPDQCPSGWAQEDPVVENGITYSFVTYHRKTPSVITSTSSIYQI